MTVLVLIHSGFRMWTIPAAQVERLRALFPSHTILHARDDAEGDRMIRRADVLFASHVHPQQLAAAERLRWIHSPTAGIGNMLYPEMVASPVVMTNSRGLSAEVIAEHVLALTLAFCRQLPLALRRQAERRWAQDEVGALNRRIAGARVLIVGLGAIGRAAAVRLSALGAHVDGIRRQATGERVEGVAATYPPGELRQHLPGADVVVLTAPQTEETRDLIGAEELALMKRDAVLVNVSRGGLVDETALAAALRAGALRGAALDVFRGEPLGPESPLWDVPNLIITPHSAGFREDHWAAAADLFAENLRRFERAAPLLNIVDKYAGY